MEVKDFCNTIGTELTGHKSKMYDIITHVDKLSADDQKRLDPQVGGLKAMIEGIDAKLKELSTVCPADWSQQAETIRREVAELQKKAQNIWDIEHIAGGYVGG